MFKPAGTGSNLLAGFEIRIGNGKTPGDFVVDVATVAIAGPGDVVVRKLKEMRNSAGQTVARGQDVVTRDENPWGEKRRGWLKK